MADNCGCCHDIKKETTPCPFTMEKLEKDIQNLNARIDIMGMSQDEKCEIIIDYLKKFFDDLVIRIKNKDKPKDPPKEGDEKKEEDLPIIERINKSLLQVLQLKPAVMMKYGIIFLEKVWELNDEENNYLLPELLLSQPFDKRLTPLEMMKYFLQLLFGGMTKIEELLEQKFIIFDEKKRKVCINEEKIKEIGGNPEKYINENNLLCNLLLIKIFTYSKTELFYDELNKLLVSIDNDIIRFYKVLSLYAFCLWNLNHKKEDLIRSLLYNIYGIIKDFSKSLLTTEKIDINNLIFFKEIEKEQRFFKAIALPEKSIHLIKKLLLITLVNFISVFVTGYDANKPYDIQDGNYWDDYYGLILRLKDPKLTATEMKEISRMIPLSLDMKNSIILFITDFLFLFVTHFTYIKDNKLISDFDGFDCLTQFAEYMILNSNYNVLTFFQKNFNYKRFNQCVSETKEYQKKDNLNTYGLFFVLFSLLQKRKVPLIIKKGAYVEVMTVYLQVVLTEAKLFGLPDKKDELNTYYINEMKKNKMIDLE